jgi:Rieske Fe-S protein
MGVETSDSALEPGRRRFLNWFLNSSLAALFAAVAYPVVRFISPPAAPESTTNRVEAGRTNDPELLEKLAPGLVESLRGQGFEVTGHRLELLGHFRDR